MTVDDMIEPHAYLECTERHIPFGALTIGPHCVVCDQPKEAEIHALPSADLAEAVA